MALLTILHYPDKRLHKIAKPVVCVDDRIRKLVADMAQTMYEAPGVGLAATQVDVHERVVVIDVSEEKNDLRVLINPEIVEKSGEYVGEEGCLSIPGYRAKVTRFEKVKVTALDRQGKAVEIETDDFLAIVLQHEIDHLHGKVFIEHLSALKQQIALKKVRKYA